MAAATQDAENSRDSSAAAPGPERAPQPPSRLALFSGLRLLGYGLWDWLFILFIWITAFYAVSIVAEAYRTGDWDIDFMPIAAGVPIIVVGWRAVSIGDRMSALITRLDDDAGLVLAEGAAIEPIRDRIAASVRRFQWASAICVGLVVGGVFSYLVATGNLAASDSAWIWLLGPVMVGVGAVLGALLGRICGYGRVMTLLERNGARFAGVITRQTRETLAGLKRLFLYGFWATAILCNWLIAWFIAWYALGFDSGGYRQLYSAPFLGFLLIGLVFHYFGGFRPMRSWFERLDAAYGATEARAGVAAQLLLARHDLEAVKDDPVAAHEIDLFIKEKERDPLGGGVIDKRFITVMLAWIALSSVVFTSLVIATYARAPSSNLNKSASQSSSSNI